MNENIRLSFRGILSHKMRSFLTMLGIIIGIAAIIAIVSTIKGTNQQIQQNLIGSGVNSVNVRITQGDYEYDFSAGIPVNIQTSDESTRTELSKIDGTEDASLFHKRQDYNGAYHLNNSLSGGYVYGIDTHYFNCTGYTIMKGRGISEEDRISYRRVAVLDENSSQQLFQGEEPLGKTIEIHGVPFTVVGIAVKSVEFEPSIKTMADYNTYSQSTSGSIYIPDRQWPSVYEYDEPQSAVIRSKNTESMTAIGKAAAAIMNTKISSTTSQYKYEAQDLLEQAKQIQQLSQSTNTMLLWIAAISLLVGGIGVMNIMLVSVTERTSEIGLKKAIGANKSTILHQFLTEAVVLTSIGGILGVIVGIILAYVISMLNGTPVAISVEASIFAVLFSMLIGIVFGILPSYKAANLDPIEALRRE